MPSAKYRRALSKVREREISLYDGASVPRDSVITRLQTWQTASLKSLRSIRSSDRS
jgi:hypothetical protein